MRIRTAVPKTGDQGVVPRGGPRTGRPPHNFALLLLLCCAGGLFAKDYQFDLVVYGATAGGAATAIAGAREGLRVALVNPGRHVGGMVSGGLSATDRGKVEVIGGISREFFERVGKRYNQPVQWNLEPHVAEDVFNEMLREAKVTVFPDSRIRESGGVVKQGKRVVRIVTDHDAFRARIFVDSTYEGDLMGFAGVSCTWGRENTSQYDELLAGVRGRQRPDHHFNVRVSPFDMDGHLLWGVQNGPKGEMGQGDKKVQAYTFRMCLASIQSNAVPYARPEHYDPSRYELLARLIQALKEAKGRPPVMKELMIMSQLPNGKFDINSFGGFSTDFIGGSWDYPAASYKRRAEIWQEHRDYEGGFFWFLAHDDRVPKALQEEVNRYGLARDEFADNRNWPYQLYIRESRRMIGEYVMTQKDIQENITKPDAIGMGSYQSDSHHVQRVATKDGAVENEGEMYVPVKPYQIPYRMILPKETEASNLLVPVCFSASHVAYSTLRMEPQYMIIGQAAGVAAAMALKAAKPVQEIDAAALSAKLKSQGAVLDWRAPVAGKGE